MSLYSHRVRLYLPLYLHGSNLNDNKILYFHPQAVVPLSNLMFGTNTFKLLIQLLLYLIPFRKVQQLSDISKFKCLIIC